MGSFAGSCEIVEEKDDGVRLPKHSGRYDIDKLFQSIHVKPSTRLMSSSFHNHETSTSAGPSRTTSPLMKTPRTPQSSRFAGLSDLVSLKQALRDRCISKASELAAQKRLSAASPRVSEVDRIKSLYNQVSNESSRSRLVPVDKGQESLVEMSVNDKPSSSKSVVPRFDESSYPISDLSLAGTSLELGNKMPEIKLLHKVNKSVSCHSSGSRDYVASPSTHGKVIDKHFTSLPSHSSQEVNAMELDKNIPSSALDSEQKEKLDDATSSGTDKRKTVCKVARMVPGPKQPKKKKILLKKKLKIRVLSATYPTKSNEEIVPSLDSCANQLLCERCHCSLKSTRIKNHPPGYTTSQNSDSLSSVSCNVSQSEAQIVIMKQDVSSYNNSGNSSKKIQTSSEKFEFSLSSKDSLGDYSSCTSMSEESNMSRFSCGNKPHMSMDVRWEAIKHVKVQYGSLGLRHFNLLKKLGCGDIGTVYLAELIGTNCLFAIKVMDNEFLARRNKSPRAQTEREILKMLDHPFLPTLYAQFTSDNLSCLVMEYCPGGDLHVLRQKQLGRCFSEPAARFYVAEILLALEYLHMLGIIYRDLKPENILVREDGHIMLTDFDLSLRCAVNPTLLRSNYPPGIDPARMSGPYDTSNCIQPFCQVSCFSPRLSSNQQQGRKPKKSDHLLKAQQNLKRSLPQLVAEPTEARSNSFVGTHEYLAPEIIKGEGHGAAVDWWTFGILLYELLYGKTPFKGYNNDKTLANVVLQNLKFPDFPIVSFQAKDLIKGLLVKEPENRLGSEKGSVEIKRHPFFEGLNWALIRCATPPELPDFYEFGGEPEKASDSPGGSDNMYLECKAIGDHIEFEFF